MSRSINFYSFLLLTIIVFNNSSFANNSPSKKETVNFIKDKVFSEEYDNLGYRKLSHLKHSEDYCTLNLYLESEKIGEGIIRYVGAVFSLKDIDPTRIEYGYSSGTKSHHARLTVTNNEKKILLYSGKKNVKSNKSYDEEFEKRYYEDISSGTHPKKVNAEKMVKALIHLVNLCGGESELF
ncbi:hypothetical protein [Pseudoalteromonas marina]|uniref:hypothetical protein n=1 Tax=Pseudoalteromonas marina TaxID=267375 RepID=UPI0023F2BD1A|nr:hypothetical protein [Pseudoalteromonas marina]